MLILIEKDSATRVPKECTLEEAQALATQFPIHVVNEDGSTTTLADHLAAQEPLTGEAVVVEPDATEPAVEKPEGVEVPAADEGPSDTQPEA